MRLIIEFYFHTRKKIDISNLILNSNLSFFYRSNLKKENVAKKFISNLQYFFLNFITFKLDHQTPQNGDIARSIIETKTKLDIDDLFLCLTKF